MDQKETAGTRGRDCCNSLHDGLRVPQEVTKQKVDLQLKRHAPTSKIWEQLAVRLSLLQGKVLSRRLDANAQQRLFVLKWH